MGDSWTYMKILVLFLLLALLPFSVSAVVLPDAGCQCPIGLTFARSYNSTNPDLPDYGYLSCQYGNYPDTPYLVSGIGAEVVVQVGSNLYSDFQSKHKWIQELGTFSKEASNRRVIQFEDEPNRIALIYFENATYGKPFTDAYLYHYYQNSLISAFIISFEQNDARMIAILDSLESCGMGIVGSGGEVKNCTTECRSKAAHLVWDEQSEYPDCSCICEKGWEMQDLGLTVRCNPCTDLCQAKDPHSRYNEQESAPNVCECSCEQGYQPGSSGVCEKVECPPNAVNLIDLTAPCPQDRFLNKNCCCAEGAVQWYGSCLKKEELPGATVTNESEEINRSACLPYGVRPENFDLTYDRSKLRDEFQKFLKDYASRNTVKSMSDRYKGTGHFSFGQLGWFMFTTNLEKVKGSSFITGKEGDLEKRIAQRFQALGRPLTPSEVLEESFQVTENNMFDALLTSHNYLKQRAYDIRETRRDEWRTNYNQTAARVATLQQRLLTAGVIDGSGKQIKTSLDEQTQKVYDQWSKFRQELDKLDTFRTTAQSTFRALTPLRTREDNEGAWYHLFGTLTTGYAEREQTWSPEGISGFTSGEVFIEHRVWKGFIEGHLDQLEYCWDVWGGFLGGDLYTILQENQVQVKNRILANPEAWKGAVQGADPSAVTTGNQGGSLAGGGSSGP